MQAVKVACARMEGRIKSRVGIGGGGWPTLPGENTIFRRLKEVPMFRA